VSFPFDSAAVFDSHMPYGSPTMPRICLSESDLSRPWQVRCGRMTACWPLATPSSMQFVITSLPISDAVASVKQSTLREWQGRGMRTAWYMSIRLNLHMSCPYRAHAALCCGLKKSLSERRGCGMARALHGMCESNTAVLGETNEKDNLNC
jgi:hypothetical protein